MAMPSAVNRPRNVLRAPAPSASAPSSGAATSRKALASELAKPSRAVLTTASAPSLQYSLKNTGKKPAITVVAKTELAQS